MDLRRKCIGVLLKNKPSHKRTQTFVIKMGHDEIFTMITLEPIYPNCKFYPYFIHF